MKKLTLSIILILIGFLSASAQNYCFRVLSVQGKAVFQSTSNVETKLTTGASLLRGGKIIVSEGAKLTLVHLSNKVMEISKAGTFKIDDLEKDVKNMKGSISSKYVQYVADGIFNNESDNYRSKMKSVGAVERSFGESGDVNAAFDKLILLYKNTSVLDDHVELKWNRVPETSQYIVKLYNSEDKVVSEFPVKDTVFDLKMDLSKLEKLTCNFWTLSVSINNKTLESKKMCLFIPSDEEKKSMKSELFQVQSECSSLDKHIQELILGKFYESNNYMPQAFKHYQAAYLIDKSNDAIAKSFEVFLTKIGAISISSDVMKSFDK